MVGNESPPYETNVGWHFTRQSTLAGENATASLAISQ
jgi:hypothetical protein